MSKVKNFFLSLTPLVIFVAATILMTFGFIGLLFIIVMISAGADRNTMEGLELAMNLLFDGKIQILMLMLLEIWLGVLFLLWYKKAKADGTSAFTITNFNGMSFWAVILLAAGMSILITYFTELEAYIKPNWYIRFEELMENAGLGSDMPFWAILYVCILGPMMEELIFRGLTYHYAKKAFPVWLAIIWQAFLFGVFHENLFQGVYAFLIGLLLGILAEKSGSLLWTMFFHIFYNTMVTFVAEPALAHADDNYFYFITTLTIGVVLTLVALHFFFRGIEQKKLEMEYLNEDSQIMDLNEE